MTTPLSKDALDVLFHQARTHNAQRYGKKSVTDYDLTVQDWGITYDELELHYDQFDRLCGTSGKAGNLNGKIQPGGDPS